MLRRLPLHLLRPAAARRGAGDGLAAQHHGLLHALLHPGHEGVPVQGGCRGQQRWLYERAESGTSQVTQQAAAQLPPLTSVRTGAPTLPVLPVFSPIFLFFPSCVITALVFILSLSFHLDFLPSELLFPYKCLLQEIDSCSVTSFIIYLCHMTRRLKTKVTRLLLFEQTAGQIKL